MRGDKMLTRMMIIVAAALTLMGMAPRPKKPAAISEGAGTFDFKIERGRVSLDAREADLRRILEDIGENTGIVMDIDDKISEKETTLFKEVPFKEAIEKLAGKYDVEYENAYGAEDVVVKVAVSEKKKRADKEGIARNDRMGPAGGSPKPAGEGQKEENKEWKSYENNEWGFSCEYPKEWKVESVVENPGSPDNVIKEKIEFRAPEGQLFWLDVWVNTEGLGLQDWFKKYFINLLSDPSGAPEKVNAEIGGKPALVVINRQTMASNSLITIFERGGLVFSFTYPMGDRLTAKPIYDQLLASFQLKAQGVK